MPKAVIENTEVYQLKSDVVGDIFEITVLEPEDVSNEPLQVIYLTDANNSLGTGCDAANLLMLGGEIPQVILVAIGYPLEGISTILSNLGRETSVLHYVNGKPQESRVS